MLKVTIRSAGICAKYRDDKPYYETELAGTHAWGLWAKSALYGDRKGVEDAWATSRARAVIIVFQSE